MATKQAEPIWETIFDLSYMAGNDKLVENNYFDYDSRLLYEHIQKWANEFETKFDGKFDYQGGMVDYFVEIEKFYQEKKLEVE
jgi:hypothetical protein